jgi:hypothetical protein
VLGVPAGLTRFSAPHLLAPPAWRDEIILIAATTLIAAVGKHAPDTWWLALAVMPLWHIEERLDTRAPGAARAGSG